MLDDYWKMVKQILNYFNTIVERLLNDCWTIV